MCVQNMCYHTCFPKGWTFVQKGISWRLEGVDFILL